MADASAAVSPSGGALPCPADASVALARKKDSVKPRAPSVVGAHAGGIGAVKHTLVRAGSIALLTACAVAPGTEEQQAATTAGAGTAEAPAGWRGSTPRRHP